jgi:hypothetical protein
VPQRRLFIPVDQLAFGGGYRQGLEDTLIATSPTFGWRDQVVTREVIKAEHNLFGAVAERSVVLGYEQMIAGVEVTG